MTQHINLYNSINIKKIKILLRKITFQTILDYTPSVFKAKGETEPEVYLTIIPRARMDSESITHQGERDNCFSEIQLVSQEYRDKKT